MIRKELKEKGKLLREVYNAMEALDTEWEKTDVQVQDQCPGAHSWVDGGVGAVTGGEERETHQPQGRGQRAPHSG